MNEQEKNSLPIQRKPQQTLPERKNSEFNANPLLMAAEHWERLNKICTDAARSGLLPRAIDSASKALIVALKGIEMGFSPLQAFERINVVEGKAVIDGQGMLTLIMTRDSRVQVEWLESTETICKVSIKNPSQEKSVVETWTIARAVKAKLTNKNNWQNYPTEMLRWRALASCARIAVPHLIGGCYTADEMGLETDVDGKWIGTTMPDETLEAAKSVTPVVVFETVSPSKSNGELIQEIYQTGEDKGISREEIKQFISNSYPQEKTLNRGKILLVVDLVKGMQSRIEPIAKQANQSSEVMENDKMPFEKEVSK